MRQQEMCAIILSLCVVAPPAPGQEVLSAGDAEKSLRDVLTRCRAHLAEQPAYEVRVESKWESGSEKEKITGAKAYRLVVVRPAKVFLTMTTLPDAGADLEVIGDGKTLLAYLPKGQVYSMSAMPGARAGLEKNVVIAQSLVGSGLEIVARPDAPTFVLAQVSNIIDRGEEELRDIKGRHFSVTWGESRVQLWFTSGEKPLLSRFKRSSKLPGADGATYEMEMSSDLTWNFAPETSAEMFHLTAPKEAKKVRDLYAHLSGEEANVSHPSPSAVELMGIDGTKKNWPSGKEVLVLVTAAWGTESAELIERFGAGDAKGLARVVVVVADELEQAKRVLPRASGGAEVFVDRSGELPASLNAEELPLLVRVKNDEAVWQQGVEPGNLSAAIEAATASGSK